MLGELRQAEVHDFDLALFVQHQIGGFDVAVNDATAVSRLQALGGLSGDVDYLVEFERAIADFVLDGAARDEGHSEEGLSLGLVDFIDGANVGMVECRRGLGFAKEAFLGFGVFNDVGAEKLQRDRTLKLGVEGFVDHAHAALAEFFGDLVVRDGETNHAAPLAATR